ncbi:hypothetical protein DFH11DRAFT_869142 [Phellopilus nigrolimitatus]|nr:hypothetical protein DFH11DRAFT_869142 [Phellopilus nigrolimitatus]
MLINMCVTQFNEGENPRFRDVPGLLESKFSDAVLARGVGHHVDIPAIFAGLKKIGADTGGYLPLEKRPDCARPGSWANWFIESDRIHEDKAHHVNTMMCEIEGMFPTLRRSKPRVFDARFFGIATAGATSMEGQCTPGMVLLDRNDAKKQVVAWSQIRSTWELKGPKIFNAPLPRKKASRQHLQSARLIFASQLLRRFVCGMTMLNDDATFHVFDRSGMISSENFNIHMEPEKFLRAVLGFFLADDTDLGLDTSIVYEGKKRFMTVAGIKYEILREIYVESCVRGRGMVCFLAMHNNKEYVINDSWVDDSRHVFEHEILKRVKHLDGVPTMIAHECVKIHGMKDTTAIDRAFLHDPELLETVKPVLRNKWTAVEEKTETRERRRTVTEPFGDSLEDFSCLYELVLAIKNIFQIIKKVTNEGVVHQDINLRNIILAKDNNGGRFRKAFLINFDQAINTTEQLLELAKVKRTGTLPFMAIGILQAQNRKSVLPHGYNHDLESVFYIFCWICTVIEGPYGKVRTTDNFKIEMSEVAFWAGVTIPNYDLGFLSCAKTVVMRNETEFDRSIIKKIAPYFADLGPCLSSIRKVLFLNPSDNNMELEDAMRVMEEQMKKAPEDRCKFMTYLAQRKIYASNRTPDDIFAELDKILDDTLVDLSNKGKDRPEVRQPRMNRTSNACLDGLLQYSASRVKPHNIVDGTPRKDSEEEKPMEEEPENATADIDADAEGEGDGEVMAVNTEEELWKATSGEGAEDGSTGSGNDTLELPHGESVKNDSEKDTSSNGSLSPPLHTTPIGSKRSLSVGYSEDKTELKRQRQE